MVSARLNAIVRLSELTFVASDDTLAADVRALLDPAATFRLSGKETDVDGYLRHVVEFRSAMTDGTIAIVEEIDDSGGLAARVVVRMAMKDGSVMSGESHVIGRAGEDGRITRMVEIGRLIVEGDDPTEVG